jgi:tetratricopeptide (TPR) repeat protein
MSVSLERRLANFRTGLAGDRLDHHRARLRSEAAIDGADRLARSLGGRPVEDVDGAFVLVESPPVRIPIDRDRLALLPGHPPPDVPLVCLDTETTGLATAAGTLAFLVGLGWWEGDLFHQVQLLLPDHADEPPYLRALAGHLATAPWLVSYNGRGFDWPLLITRYRMGGAPAPQLGGHLDLLPVVRRIFRHRLPDARLRSVEEHLLDVHRIEDVAGWEIPGRYFDVLRGDPPELLWDVLRHNEEDVRSLARLTALLAGRFGDPDARRREDPGDLAGLARAYRLDRRLDEALACLDLALAAEAPAARPAVDRHAIRDVAWWDRAADLPWGAYRPVRLGPVATTEPWTEEGLLIERAHILRRLDRHAEAADTWAAIGAGPGRVAAMAWLEVAKLRERWLGDISGALDAAERGLAALERRRRIGWPEPRLEALAARRIARLRRRLARAEARRARDLELAQPLAARRARAATAMAVGTPARPTSSTVSEAAAAATRRAAESSMPARRPPVARRAAM